MPNARHKLAFSINNNFNFSDMTLLRYFNEKSTNMHFNHPPAYAYWYTGLFGVGLFFGAWGRFFYGFPEHVFRRTEYLKPFPDKHYMFSFSLPHYNHWLRAWSSKFRASFLDNEPDYNAYHPWAIRPNRNLHYARFPSTFAIPRYFIDDPNFERTLHVNMERHYESLGYYPDRKKKEESEDEEDE